VTTARFAFNNRVLETPPVQSERFSQADVLACPACHGPLATDADGVAPTCARCGTVGRRVVGLLDFTTGDSLPMAARGVFDLRRDEEFAHELAREASTESFDALCDRVSRADEANEPRASGSAAACERYSRFYAEIENEVGLRHGDAILSKLDAIRAEEGAPPVTGRWALEAGGGPGKFLPDFAKRFGAVVYVDCSLVNLILARKLADEQGARNVCFIRASVDRLPLRTGAIDFIHENGVIEHVADPQAMVREAKRLLSPRGTYFCLSPNRFPLTPEPHFRIPLFGIFPRPIRRVLVARVRGLSTEAGTDLQSLRQLKRIFRAAEAGSPRVLFLPRLLRTTARATPARRIVRRILGTPVLGRLLAATINGPLLPIMPYHIAILPKRFD